MKEWITMKFTRVSWLGLPLIEWLILLLAAGLRLWALGVKPPHFDEGINGWFADRIREIGYYAYDPTNYHGPLYFYMLFVAQVLFGRSLWVLRMPAVLASIMSVGAALRFKQFFGSKAARLGALALAVSPAAVFYGRYAIHESWVTVSLMILLLGIFGLWQLGNRCSLLTTFFGVTLLLLLKETFVIHIGCLLLAVPCFSLWQRMVPSSPALLWAKQSWSWRDFIIALGVSLMTLFLFYSGMLLNMKGIIGFFQALVAWVHTGVGAGGHVKEEYQVGVLNWYWIALMIRYEWPSLLGVLFTLRLLGKAPAMVRYLGIYAMGVLLAYSIVPYKTPWCIISIIWPFALLFGMAIQEMWQFRAWRLLIGIVGGILLLGSLVLCLELNFWNYANFEEPYVYVQTSPEINLATEPLLKKAQKDPRAYQLKGEVFLESYYPLPWILGDFPNIAYFSKDNLPQKLSGDFIMTEVAKSPLVEGRLQGPYYRQQFKLRDAMGECMVYFKTTTFPDLLVEKVSSNGGRSFSPELLPMTHLPRKDADDSKNSRAHRDS